MKGSVLIGQSGGPTAVINASLQGIIEEAFKNPLVTNVYGALNGIDGILNHQIIDFKYETKENLSLLKTTPSSILGSVRFKLEDYQKNDEIYKTIVSIFSKLNFLLINNGIISIGPGRYKASACIISSRLDVFKFIINFLIPADSN